MREKRVAGEGEKFGLARKIWIAFANCYVSVSIVMTTTFGVALK
jgi:hypothetical protein